ncbi:tyrosine-type recombinase/integrase [Pantoea sp. ACRSB]|uniref:tyrosine-type recombinase/integrase n=1 Tax=Pantoea sp. ACRSB TaxID=2918207 RepID=UPI0028938299|nr:tyrosine-type recombinase/integrase [Pantoea sp. ACRSB]MCG7389681.1 tyrosine-type recombinase/integrase [Pantoea sp. ACRSB]
MCVRKRSGLARKYYPGLFPRARCGLDAIENPPTFHEIRSLSGRLYEARHGEAFAQRLLGHKNLSMTKKYLDPRRDEYVLV